MTSTRSDSSDRLANAVGHEQHGLAVALPQLEQHDVHVVARDGVERAERLIHQEDAGIGDERAAERYPLPHAAGELVRPLVDRIVKPDETQQLHRPAEVG